ncbi:Ig-like domain-containing protein [Bacteroides thetaiotaomicron]|uniref:Chitobiase n=1 Tax=Bacteroides thetaiotaomicron TaxID=818 RepID=A0A174P0S9_BACT4|nr:Ig-like domain-containing protein [Bacteroides thetaiotaomicron]CUP54642.1 chitobiase [Bacteroides thetaiotaomicron]
MKLINYILGIVSLLLLHSCVEGDGMVSGAGESYRIKADLESKGQVDGLYDKGMQTFTLSVTWKDLFVNGKDAVTGIKIYKGNQRSNPIRTLKSSNNNPTNENGMNFMLSSFSGLSLEEERALIQNDLYLAITTTSHEDGIVIGQMVCNTYEGKDSYEIETIKLQDNATEFRVAMGLPTKLPVLVTPYYADNTALNYESLNIDIFTITNEGVITGVKPGIGKVKVSSLDGTDIIAIFTIQITSPETVSDISFVDANDLFIIKGEEPLQLKWTVLPVTAVNKEVIFTSSDETVATVDEDGKVTAISSGTVTITATAKDGAGALGICKVKIYGIYQELDRSAWTATATSYQNGNNPERAFDGNGNTMWHNKWGAGTGTPDLPQTLLIDMGEGTRLSQVELDRRNDGQLTDVNTVEIYVGDHPDNAPLVGSIVFGDANNKDVTGRSFFGATSGRYLKLVFTKSNRDKWVSAAEVRAYLIE